MIEHKTLYVGDSRSGEMSRTVEVFTSKLRGIGRLSGRKLLDVGCGNGTFTIALSHGFEEVYGIDVRDDNLEIFRRKVDGNSHFKALNMSASEMTFPDSFFDSIITIETLEHVPELQKAASEIARVLAAGGELLITVPNRWFPFENHGARIGSRLWRGRVPLLPYFPWLHRRFAVARVFTVGDLDALFLPEGLIRADHGYLWPTFEHDGNPFQRFLRPLFGVMRKMEVGSLRFFGSSVVVKYIKSDKKTN
ncbi:MAG: class I SAM-dependent methyltransferase [Verrucomicrobiota bacterium]